MTLGSFGGPGASFYYQVRLESLVGFCEISDLWTL